MKENVNKQFTAILSMLLFSIGLLISFSLAAMPEGEPAAREAGDAALQGQIDALQTQVNGLTPATHIVGEMLYDGSIVFWVDETGQHGLAAWPSNDFISDWYEAKERADDHGPGWRLPTKHELNLLFLQRDIVGGLVGPNYWSSTEFDATSAWVQGMDAGYQAEFGKNRAGEVRAVRAF